MEVRTNPFYELRNRLYASAAAGCSLIAEDFRLKRAIEAFQPMSEANKVFGRLYAMCSALLGSENKAADIIDCIALADALAVTQGTFADCSETAPAEPREYIKPAQLTLNALEANREKIRKTQYADQEYDGEFFRCLADPRILSAFLDIAGKNGTGVADLLVNAEAVYGETIVPLLFDSLDLSESRATGNQIRFISSVYRDKYNDRYTALAEDESVPQGIRIAAIEAMAYSADNEEKLTTLYKISKGKVKNAALLSLAKLNSEAAEAPIKKMADSPKSTSFEFLVTSYGEAAENYARKENLHVIENGIKDKDPEHPFKYGYYDLLANKKDGIIDVYERWAEDYYKRDPEKVPYSKEPRYTSINKPLISNLFEHEDEVYRDMIRRLYSKYPVYFSLSALVLELTEDPENACKKICTDHRSYDRDVIYIIRHIFATPDGWYRLRRNYSSSSEDYLNIKLFRSITDDILSFMTDPVVVYDHNEIQVLLKTGRERDIAVENMKQRCTLFQYLLGICQPSDRERVRAAAEKFAWNMIRNYPCDEAMLLLPKVASRPLDGMVYNYARFILKHDHPRYWTYYIENNSIPEEVIIGDCKRLMAEMKADKFSYNNVFMDDIKRVLANHGVKE